MNLSACSLTSYFTCNLCSIFDFITVAAPYLFLRVFGMFFRLKTDKNLYSCTFRDIIIFFRRLNEESFLISGSNFHIHNSPSLKNSFCRFQNILENLRDFTLESAPAASPFVAKPLIKFLIMEIIVIEIQPVLMIFDSTGPWTKTNSEARNGRRVNSGSTQTSIISFNARVLSSTTTASRSRR